MTIATVITIGVIGALAYHMYANRSPLHTSTPQAEDRNMISKIIGVWNKTVEKNPSMDLSRHPSTMNPDPSFLPSCLVLQDNWLIDSVKNEILHQFIKKCVLTLKKDRHIDIFIDSWITCHVSELSLTSKSRCFHWMPWDRNFDVRIPQQADEVIKEIQEIFQSAQKKGGKECVHVERVCYFDGNSGSGTGSPLFFLKAYRVTLISPPKDSTLQIVSIV